jgi:hypothetical protein
MKKNISNRLACTFCDVENDELIKDDQKIVFSGFGRIICEPCARKFFKSMKERPALIETDESEEQVQCLLCQSRYSAVKCVSEGRLHVCVFCLQTCKEIVDEPKDLELEVQEPEHVGNGIFYSSRQKVRCEVKQPFDTHQNNKDGYKHYEVLIIDDNLPALLWSNKELREGEQLAAEFSCFQDDAIWLHHPLFDHQ